MADYDLIVRGRKVTGERISLAVTEGKIMRVGEDFGGSAKEECGTGEELLLPGWIDAHVHFNEPGRSDWEGLATGSRALALGGGTAFFDMPLNSSPPVVDASTLREKRRLAEEKSVLDFALWGGLTPSSIDHLEGMADEGAIGFKAFMCHSGLEEYPAADEQTLKAGMQKAALRGLPIAVHAEVGASQAVSGKSLKDWFASRPKEMELDAIRLATDLAGETGCALHVVHVSTAEGIDLICKAKKRGVNVSAETCPHYLLIDVEEAARIGAEAKCAPPLQTREGVEALWRRLKDGEIDTIGSDHSPAPPEMKEGNDMFQIWGGIAGIQHGLPLLLEEGFTAVDLLSKNVAERFGLEEKGGLEVGKDADFSLVKVLREKEEVARNELVTRHPLSPYCGRLTAHRVMGTWLRGLRRGLGDDRHEVKFLKPMRD